MVLEIVALCDEHLLAILPAALVGLLHHARPNVLFVAIVFDGVHVQEAVLQLLEFAVQQVQIISYPTLIPRLQVLLGDHRLLAQEPPKIVHLRVIG